MRNRIVDGVELLRLIRDREIKVNDKVKYGNIIFTLKKGNLYNFLVDENGNDLEEHGLSTELMIYPECKFEILSNEEEEKEIDIEKIESLKTISFNNFGNLDYESSRKITDKINELVIAVKQLDKYYLKLIKFLNKLG